MSNFSAILWREQFIFDEMIVMSHCTRPTCLPVVGPYWNYTWTHYPDSEPTSLCWNYTWTHYPDSEQTSLCWNYTWKHYPDSEPTSLFFSLIQQ